MYRPLTIDTPFSTFRREKKIYKIVCCSYRRRRRRHSRKKKWMTNWLICFRNSAQPFFGCCCDKSALPPVWRFVGGLYIQYNNRKWNITKDFSLSPLSLCMYNVYLASFFFWFVDWRGFIHQCVMCAGFMYANNAKDIYHTYTSGVWNYKNGAGKNIKFHTARCSVSPSLFVAPI